MTKFSISFRTKLLTQQLLSLLQIVALISLPFPKSALALEKVPTNAAASAPLVTTTAPAKVAVTGTPQAFVLPNGLKIVVLEDHSFPVVSCFVWYKAGSANETPGLTGLSHIVEHLLFQSVGRYRKGELGATIVRNGGQFNGFTSDDFTAFFETIHPSKLDLVLKIESERMRSATFTEADLASELTRVKAELDQDEKDPRFNLVREVHAAAYVQHPYGNPTVGWKNDIGSITLHDAKEFYDRFFHPNNATLVVVGDARTQVVLNTVSKYFGAIPKFAGTVAGHHVVQQSQMAERRVLIHGSGKKDEILVAYHAPAFSDIDIPAMLVLEKSLNVAISGRLKTKLVDAKVCGYAKSALELKRDPGLFTVAFSAPAGSGSQKILESWDALANQLRNQPLSDVELRRAKNQAEFAFVAERDGPYKAGFQLGYCDVLDSWRASQAWTDKVRAVTAADVLRVCKKYLVPENRVVGVMSANGAKPASSGTSSPSSKVPPKTAIDSNLNLPKALTNRDFEHVKLCAYKSDDSTVVNQINLDSGTSTGESDGIVNSKKFKAPPPAGIPNLMAVPAKPDFDMKIVPPAQEEATKSADSDKLQPEASQAPVDSLPARAQELIPQQQSQLQSQLQAKALPTLRRKMLKNGIVAIVLESHLSPIVQINGAIKAGEVFDPAGKKGLSALCSHVLNNGAAKLGRVSFVQQQEDAGLIPSAMLKFETSPETVNFQTRCLSRDFATQLNLLGSTIRDPALQDADIEKSKADFFGAMKNTEESVLVRVNRALLRSVIASNTAYYPIDPTEKAKETNQLKSADVRDFLAQYLTPDATVIVIAGDINPDTAFNLIEKSFDGWSSGAQKSGRTFPAATESQRKLLKASIPLSEDKGKTTVSVGRLVKVAVNQKDYSSLLISDCALNNHPIFSRMIQRINREPGLSDSLSFENMESRFVPLSNMISWSLTVPTEPQLVAKTTIAIQSELKNFTSSGMTAEELGEVKRYMAAALPVRLMPSTSEAAKNILNGYFQGADGDFLNQLVKLIRGADLASVNSFIKNDFAPAKSVLIVCGQPQSIKQVSVSSGSSQSNASKQDDESRDADDDSEGSIPKSEK